MDLDVYLPCPADFYVVHIVKDVFHVFQGGMYVLTLMDWYSTGLALLLIGIVECIVINFIYGNLSLSQYIYTQSGIIYIYTYIYIYI